MLSHYGGTLAVVAAFALLVSVPLAVPGLVSKDTIRFEAVAAGTPGGDRIGASAGEQRGPLGSLARQLEPTGVLADKGSGLQVAKPFRAVTDRLRPKSSQPVSTAARQAAPSSSSGAVPAPSALSQPALAAPAAPVQAPALAAPAAPVQAPASNPVAQPTVAQPAPEPTVTQEPAPKPTVTQEPAPKPTVTQEPAPEPEASTSGSSAP